MQLRFPSLTSPMMWTSDVIEFTTSPLISVDLGMKFFFFFIKIMVATK